MPIGAWARVVEGRLVLDAMVGSIDGTVRLDVNGSVAELSKAEQLGRRLAKKLYEHGAKEILDDIRAATPRSA